ncbi:MAG TPA: BMP family ABC transporter substrate-binding protein, partial [Casimicrobiaceae bacterium]|nr:BMP family ABC transporter substrate-binding protein [Casimicrobiaceae bacterium]
MFRSASKLALGTLVALAATSAGFAQQKSTEPLKVGFVYVSPIADAGWTHQHDIARQAMEKAL